MCHTSFLSAISYRFYGKRCFYTNLVASYITYCFLRPSGSCAPSSSQQLLNCTSPGPLGLRVTQTDEFHIFQEPQVFQRRFLLHRAKTKSTHGERVSTSWRFTISLPESDVLGIQFSHASSYIPTRTLESVFPMTPHAYPRACGPRITPLRFR